MMAGGLSRLAMLGVVFPPPVVGRMPSVVAAWRPKVEAVEWFLVEAAARHPLEEERRPWVVAA